MEDRKIMFLSHLFLFPSRIPVFPLLRSGKAAPHTGLRFYRLPVGEANLPPKLTCQVPCWSRKRQKSLRWWSG